jgi:hypothetical protein
LLLFFFACDLMPLFKILGCCEIFVADGTPLRSRKKELNAQSVVRLDFKIANVINSPTELTVRTYDLATLLLQGPAGVSTQQKRALLRETKPRRQPLRALFFYEPIFSNEQLRDPNPRYQEAF